MSLSFCLTRQDLLVYSSQVHRNEIEKKMPTNQFKVTAVKCTRDFLFIRISKCFAHCDKEMLNRFQLDCQAFFGQRLTKQIPI